MKKILTIALVALAVAGVVLAVLKKSNDGAVEAVAAPVPATATAAPASVGALPADGVVVTYFTTDVRCASCHKIETMTRAVVEAHFADDLASGRVVFLTINTDRAENKHLIQEYELVSKTIIVSERHGGSQTAWVNLQDVWLKLNNPDDFDDYVAGAVRRALGEPS